MKPLPLVTLLFLIACSSASQPQEIIWKAEFGSSYPYNASILQTMQVTDGIVFILMRSGLTGSFSPERPLVNTDTVFRHWIIKYSNDGELRWKYLLDYCHGGMLNLPAYHMTQKNNNLFVWANITHHDSGKCDNAGRYLLLSLDENGNERFFKKLNYKPDFVRMRNKDILLFSRVDRDIAIRSFDHQGNRLPDSARVHLAINYYQADVNDHGEVVVFFDGKVVKLNADLSPATVFTFSPDYSTREYGHPDDLSSMRMIGRDKLIVYYSNERTIKDTDSIGRYNEQIYLLFVDIAKKKFWFTDFGELPDDDLILNAWAAHGNIYVTYFAYVNPANLEKRKVIANLNCFSEGGDLRWKKTYPTVQFTGSLSVISGRNDLMCFYLTPPTDYKVSRDEKVTFERISSAGKSLEHGILDVGNNYTKHIKMVYKIGEGDYLIVLSFDFRAAIVRLKSV